MNANKNNVSRLFAFYDIFFRVAPIRNVFV